MVDPSYQAGGKLANSIRKSRRLQALLPQRAALVWSYFPTCAGAQIRSSLGKSALDLGAVGRDVKFGFGLVQAKAAYDRIKSVGCGN